MPNCEINHILAWDILIQLQKIALILPSQHALIVVEGGIPAQEMCERQVENARIEIFIATQYYGCRPALTA